MGRTATIVKDTLRHGFMTVMRVRPNFAGPYKKCKYFSIEKEMLKSKRSFVKRIETIARNWPSGTYYLKQNDGTIFVRFEIIHGKVTKIHEKSPITEKPYPWVQVISAA